MKHVNFWERGFNLMGRLDKEKVYKDISSFIYKYTHDSALTYPLPEDYVELSKDMHFSKNILRITFPEGEHVRFGRCSWTLAKSDNYARKLCSEYAEYRAVQLESKC